ncbi:CocE/NonD family hydrolase [Sphingopyxis sp. GW247-27LB]|uniref:CocE/NonD family hydrolase n=1 Tax=Sphingopyxis sp. GW247-27LB TaxID=2012632 RepID=UPI000BA53F31|nr:CocE/NonD family hydrolase [Sphingopyxis sp. GW247-27LB]PAL21507.1 hypothetical protein CD928_14110 [Sphingopyxis sp. GW247-27LB]
MPSIEDFVTRERYDRRKALKAAAAGIFVASAGTAAASAMASSSRESAFGVYRGYSSERYDGWQRTSQYVAVRDGTRLAIDIFRPTLGGKLHAERLPVIWEPKRYQRATVKPDSSLRTTIDSDLTDVPRFLKHGYVVVSVDRRGTGASFGTRDELSDPLDATDGYDITEWLAEQSWSNSKIGMFGASYEGEMQLRVAGTRPPHLKAIMPEVSPFDWYWIVHTGGIHRSSFNNFGAHVSQLDLDPKNGAVDADADQSLLNAAIAEHKAGNSYRATAGALPARDSSDPVTGHRNWMERHGGIFADDLSKSGVAVYHRVGWFAGVMVDQLAWYINQKAGPKKMMVGPWGGRGVPPEAFDLWATEGLRFFDYWLKDVPNGIMDDPPIHSSVPNSHSRAGTKWRGLQKWPLPGETRTDFFFREGKSGTVASINDGRLALERPNASEGRDDQPVRFDLAYGPTRPNLPTDPAGPGQTPADHSGFDAQGLTYTSDPLLEDLEITGHPVATLWTSSTAKDCDYFVKLQDVGPDGASTYVSEGALRASCRKTGEPPYDFMGLPWPTCRLADRADMAPGKPAELAITMTPISYILQKGHRFRVTITGSETAIAVSPEIDPPPVMSIHRNQVHGSSITLPIIPA